MQNAVYIRLAVYVLSTAAGLIPAAWAGFISYDEAAQMVQISIPGLVTAIATGFGVTGAIFAKWGTR